MGLQYYSYNKNRPAKSGSGQILGIGYPNLVSSRESISVHSYLVATGLTAFIDSEHALFFLQREV